MREELVEAYRVAQEFADEAQEILGVSEISERLSQMKADAISLDSISSRGLGVGDVASIAGLLVSLIAFTQQIHAGHTLKGASRKEVYRELSLLVFEAGDLQPLQKERLLNRLIDRVLPDTK